MVLAVAISLFFGLVATLAVAGCFASLKEAGRQYRAIRADLRSFDRAPARPAASPVRRLPQDALARALAA